MTDAAPQGNPGDILNVPMLKIQYRTDPEAIAKLLPPGIEPGADPKVFLTFYSFPVMNEPEYGLVMTAAADYKGIQGEYALGYAIDQETAIYVSREHWGQPKYLADIRYFRMMDHVEASVTHAGHTFAEFSGDVTSTDPSGEEFEVNEWWIKVARSVTMMPNAYDYPPRIVRVRAKYRTAYRQSLSGEIILRESPLDPLAQRLPMREQLDAYLWTPQFLDREITIAGDLDPEGFWPFASTVNGTRFPMEA